jgi:leader peptidase (prepilin peptidase)/N-methyltransferase
LALTSYPTGGRAVLAAAIVAVLVVLAAIDIERRIVPNRIVLPATAIVLVAHIGLAPHRSAEFLIAAVGAALVFAVPSLIRRSLIGMGDAKLAMLIGASLGWAAFGALALAFLSLWPVAVAMLIRRGLAARKATLPFAPFLAFGALVVIVAPAFLGVAGV